MDIREHYVLIKTKHKKKTAEDQFTDVSTLITRIY